MIEEVSQWVTSNSLRCTFCTTFEPLKYISPSWGHYLARGDASFMGNQAQAHLRLFRISKQCSLRYRSQNNHSESESLLGIKDYFPWGFSVPSHSVFLPSCSCLLSHLSSPLLLIFNSLVSFSLSSSPLVPSSLVQAREPTSIISDCVSKWALLLIELLKSILTSSKRKSNYYGNKVVTNLQGKIKHSPKVFVRESPYAHIFASN